MTRVCLVDKTVGGQFQAPVEDLDLIRPIAPFTDPASNLQFEVLGKALFVPFQVIVDAKGSKVVAVDDDAHLPLWMMKTTWRR